MGPMFESPPVRKFYKVVLDHSLLHPNLHHRVDERDKQENLVHGVRAPLKKKRIHVIKSKLIPWAM